MDEIINYPLVSIVTVTYNNAEELEETIKSVSSQSYKNIEYIIIDGGSTDQTVSILNKYNDDISCWISEKDDGIYDAMNKGHNLAKGDYILFLNSGDILYNSDVLYEVFTDKEILQNMPLLIMGKIECQFDKNLCWISCINSKINIQYTPPHQAIFIKNEIYKKYNYNKHFRILGDRDYWLRLYTDDMFKVYMKNLIISKYALGGVSSNPNNINIMLQEIFVLSCLYLKRIHYLALFKEYIKAVVKIVIYSVLGEKKYYSFLGKFIHKEH